MTVTELRDTLTKAIRHAHFCHFEAMDEGHEGKHPDCTTFSYDLIAPGRCCECESPAIDAGEVSDGYHTFNELYDHRVSLFIALCAEVDARTPTGYVWRSHRHSDGTMIEGWFIMGIGTEPGEQITYHLPLARWPDTEWLGTERLCAPEFDGHTSADVLQRLRRYFR